MMDLRPSVDFEHCRNGQEKYGGKDHDIDRSAVTEHCLIDYDDTGIKSSGTLGCTHSAA